MRIHEHARPQLGHKWRLPGICDDKVGTLNSLFRICNPYNAGVTAQLYDCIPYSFGRPILVVCGSRDAQLVPKSGICDEHVMQYVRRVPNVADSELRECRERNELPVSGKIPIRGQPGGCGIEEIRVFM